MSSLATNPTNFGNMDDISEEDSNQRRIYVGGVPPGMDSRDVYEFFTKFGSVEFAKVHGGMRTNFAFVTFQSRESWNTALKAGVAELTLWSGEKLKVGAARSKENIPPEIMSRTWFRSTEWSKPREEENSADAGYRSSSVETVEAVQHYHMPPTDLQYNIPSAQTLMSPMISHPQYFPFNNISTEQQFIYYNYLADQQVFSPVVYNNYLNNHEMFNPVTYYYTNMTFTPYQQQFPQYENFSDLENM